MDRIQGTLGVLLLQKDIVAVKVCNLNSKSNFIFNLLCMQRFIFISSDTSSNEVFEHGSGSPQPTCSVSQNVRTTRTIQKRDSKFFDVHTL